MLRTRLRLEWAALLACAACASTTPQKSTGTNWIVVGGQSPASDGAPGTAGFAGTGCYSPGQNLEHAYEQTAVGCRCAVGAPGFCMNGVALECTAHAEMEFRWQAVEDGPCATCWTPDTPYLAAGNPSNGCPCTVEGQTACMFTPRSSYMTATCRGGKWTASAASVPCPCTSDAQCGYGSRCDAGSCVRGSCEIDGMLYAAGTSGNRRQHRLQHVRLSGGRDALVSALPVPYAQFLPDEHRARGGVRGVRPPPAGAA